MLVTAGAGSGKTRVLVERYVSLLGECRIPEIAAVTFTDAAASEMRERVRRRCSAAASWRTTDRHIDEADNRHDPLAVQRILREHPVEAGIDPTARILAQDETELEALTACADALEEAAGADDRRALALQEIGVYSLTGASSTHGGPATRDRSRVRSAGGGAAGVGRRRSRTLLDDGVAAAVEQARPWVVETAAWLRAGSRWSGAGRTVLPPRGFLEALGDPAAGDWRDLLDRLTEAGGHINLSGGSAKNWTHDLAGGEGQPWEPSGTRPKTWTTFLGGTSTTTSPWTPSTRSGASSTMRVHDTRRGRGSSRPWTSSTWR